MSAVQFFWKHCGKRSNFSFSHSVFCRFGELSGIFIKFEFVVCKLFQFGRVLNFFWERVEKIFFKSAQGGPGTQLMYHILCTLEKNQLIILLHLTLSQTSPDFYVSTVQVFWKHWGKRINCSWRAIYPFPSVFSTGLDNFRPFSSNSKLLSVNSSSLEESKICC